MGWLEPGIGLSPRVSKWWGPSGRTLAPPSHRARLPPTHSSDGAALAVAKTLMHFDFFDTFVFRRNRLGDDGCKTLAVRQAWRPSPLNTTPLGGNCHAREIVMPGKLSRPGNCQGPILAHLSGDSFPGGVGGWYPPKKLSPDRPIPGTLTVSLA